MTDSRSSNKRIAKNTLYMYMRMLLLMAVSLYTSRVVLQTLGIEDFGTYSIVGGVVIMFTFISNAMATGTQRHLSYELGKDTGNVGIVFSACFKIHLGLSLLVLILAETLGLWFLNSKMNFPPNSITVVNWIYQFSIITCLIGIIQVPYTAAIIAYEKMSFYAIISIVEAFMKLGVVFLLRIIPFNKLFLYGLLVAIVSICIFYVNTRFCYYQLANIRIIRVHNKSLYKKLISFSGWLLFGSLANVGYQQGVNIIINIFYGVVANAAVGIANQVNSAVQSFVSNFQQALNPQLIQSEASKNRERQNDLIYKSSKFSFFIMYVIFYPLVINLSYILTIWLNNYPSHTTDICFWVLVGVLISSLSGPLWVTIYAIGKVKTYQIVVSIIAISVLPIIYIGGQHGMTPAQMFIVRSSNYIIVLVAQLCFLKRYINFDCSSFVKAVLIPVIETVSITAAIYYLLINTYIKGADTFLMLVIQSVVYAIIASISVFIFGLKKSERYYIYRFVTSKIKLN